MKKKPEIPAALRICQRCLYWTPYCDNNKSHNANKECGAGWTCEHWKLKKGKA